MMGAQKGLKVLSIAVLLLGVVTLAEGVLLELGMLPGDVSNGSAPLGGFVLGLVALVSGVVSVVLGARLARAANAPRRVADQKASAWVLLVANVLAVACVQMGGRLVVLVLAALLLLASLAVLVLSRKVAEDAAR